MDQIYHHKPTGGRLYQCGAKEIPETLRRREIDLLILAAREYQPKSFNNVDKIYVPLRDSSSMSDPELQETIRKAKKAANYGISTILHGNNVLSTCWAGLNRSGIISGLMLKKLTGGSGDQVTRLIRANRSQHALFNPLFVEVLRRI